MYLVDKIPIIVYFLILLIITIVKNKETDVEEFIIGKRKIEQFGTTMTIFATLMTESLIFFAVALTVYYGPLGGLCAIIGTSLGLITMSFIASYAYDLGKKNKYVCVSEYCEQNWGVIIGNFSRILLLLLLFWVVILQINLNSSILSELLNISPVQSTFVVSIIVLFYLIFGGYRLVIRTDIFQGLLLFTILLIPFFITSRPNILSAIDTRFLSYRVLLLLMMSFAMTITRPELWQRIYSAKNKKIASKALRINALLFLIFGIFVLYYALGVYQSAPNLSPNLAFARGYKTILPPFLSMFFPVILLAAMMSSLDSAAFLLAIDLTKIKIFAEKRILYIRLLLVFILLGGGIVSLTIFDKLTFAYKINGVVALLTIPLFISQRIKIKKTVLILGFSVGFFIYIVMLFIGRFDINPDEAIFPAIIIGFIVTVGSYIDRYLTNKKIILKSLKVKRSSHLT